MRSRCGATRTPTSAGDCSIDSARSSIRGDLETSKPPPRFAASRIGPLLALVPFIVVVAAYLIASYLRLADNPQDKILPGLAQMGEAVNRLAFTPDPQSGDRKSTRLNSSHSRASRMPSSA